MFGFSLGEVLLLAVIALVVIGPKQLPEFARQIGRLINEIKRSTANFAEEMKEQSSIDFDSDKKPKEKSEESKKDSPT